MDRGDGRGLHFWDALVVGFSGRRGRSRGYCGSGVVASLVWGILWRVALAEGVAASASFSVIVLSWFVGLSAVRGGCGGVVLVYFSFGRYMWWNLNVPCVGFSAVGVSLGKKDIGVLSLQLSSVLLACPWTGFGVVVPEAVGQWRFWLELFAVGISVGEAVAFGSRSLWVWFRHFWMASGWGFLRVCVFAALWSGAFYYVVHSWGCVVAP